MNANQVQLSDIYEPMLANVVLEIITPIKTKGGVILSDKAMEELRKDLNPALRVVAVGPEVKTIKVGDWVLPNGDARPNQIMLVHTDKQAGIAHIQVHETEILGIVDSHFAQAKANSNAIVN